MARIRSSYHWRWLSRAFRRAVWPPPGGWLSPIASVAIAVVIAVIQPSQLGKSTMDNVTGAVGPVAIGTLVVFGAICALAFGWYLITEPRTMAIEARAKAEARERDWEAQVVSLAPTVDAELTTGVLSVRPYVDSRLIVGPDMPSIVAGIEYTNESASAFEGCTVTWDELAIPTYGWTKIDWFTRHVLTWDGTTEREARFAARQSRRVELVMRWPDSPVAVVKLPDVPGDGSMIPYGVLQATVSVVVDGYRVRKETYNLYWSEDGQLSIDQAGDFLT